MANKNPHKLTRKDRQKGGEVVRDMLTPEERTASARHAANSRWAGHTPKRPKAGKVAA